MKSIFKTVLMLFTLFAVGCSKKDDDKIDYYLSQPRDADLTGWWVSHDSAFMNFQQETGRIITVSCDNGDYYELPYHTYWFTEKDGDKNILHRFEAHGGFPYGSPEYHCFYKIVNDSLWLSAGVTDGSENINDVYSKTTEPKY
jgi:hypothetical protein